MWNEDLLLGFVQLPERGGHKSHPPGFACYSGRAMDKALPGALTWRRGDAGGRHVDPSSRDKYC